MHHIGLLQPHNYFCCCCSCRYTVSRKMACLDSWSKCSGQHCGCVEKSPPYSAAHLFCPPYDVPRQARRYRHLSHIYVTFSLFPAIFSLSALSAPTHISISCPNAAPYYLRRSMISYKQACSANLLSAELQYICQ